MKKALNTNASEGEGPIPSQHSKSWSEKFNRKEKRKMTNSVLQVKPAWITQCCMQLDIETLSTEVFQLVTGY